jgi:hypothetical protein
VAARHDNTVNQESEPMNASLIYPVPGRSAERNRRICGHEIGHALVSRLLGDIVWEVSAIPDRNQGGYEGRCIRSGPASSLRLDDSLAMQPDEVIGICERLECLGAPELGTSRIETAEVYVRSLNNIIALVAGEAAELLLHPDLPPLGTQHDFIEAAAFAKLTVFASPAVKALTNYAAVEAQALLTANRDMVDALVEALIETGELSGGRVDAIISETVTARAVAAETARRVDWKARQANAASFLEVRSYK